MLQSLCLVAQDNQMWNSKVTPKNIEKGGKCFASERQIREVHLNTSTVAEFGQRINQRLQANADLGKVKHAQRCPKASRSMRGGGGE